MNFTMKTLIARYFALFTLTLIGMSFSISSVSGQGLTESYGSLDIGLGFSSFEFSGDNASLSFTENSVRSLDFQIDRALQSNESFTSIVLGGKFGKYKGLSHSLYFNVPIKGSGKGKFGYSLGYNFAIEGGFYDILIRPSLGVTFGESSFKLQTLEIDTFGIVVDDTDYIDTDMDIHISQSANFVIPKLELTLLLAQKTGIWVAVGYDYSLGNKTQIIKFSGDSESKDTEFALDAAYPNLLIDGQSTTSNIFDPNGLNITFGISGYFNRD